MKWLKVGSVVFGALVITTLGISASDSLHGSSGSLLGQLTSGTSGTSVCPAGMVEISTTASFRCVDQYEESPATDCPVRTVVSAENTQANLNDTNCLGTSVAGANPWVFVTREQARAVCARAGKRLPTAAEWYTVAIGTPDTGTTCNLSGQSVKVTGSLPACKSSAGIYDAVGNAWEWVSDDIIDGSYNGRTVPQEGYVTQVASDGVATITAGSPDSTFGSDYFWSNSTGAFGMLRGGYYGSQSDGGLYSVQAKVAPTLTTGAIGFRCVR